MTDLHVVIMQNFPVSIPDFINQGLKLLMPSYKIGILRGKARNDLFGARELSFLVVALRISFKLPERISLSDFCTDNSGCCPKCH